MERVWFFVYQLFTLVQALNLEAQTEEVFCPQAQILNTILTGFI